RYIRGKNENLSVYLEQQIEPRGFPQHSAVDSGARDKNRQRWLPRTGWLDPGSVRTVGFCRVDRPEHLTTMLPSGRALFLTRQLYPMAASSQFTASRERAESRKGGKRVALEATGTILRSVAGCIRSTKMSAVSRERQAGPSA